MLPAVRELLGLGAEGVALDGPALQADTAAAGREVRAAKADLVALFAPGPQRDAASPVDGGGLVDPRPERRALAVAAAVAAGRAALSAGTDVVVLRAGTIPVLDGTREDRWTARLGREGMTDALRDEIAAATAHLARDRPRFLESLCRSVWDLSRAVPEVRWCVETPASLAGAPFPDEIAAFFSELRGRRVGWWHDTAHAARLGAFGVADPRAWLEAAGTATLGVTVSDWSPPAFGDAYGQSGAASIGRTPPGAGIVDWTSLRAQLSAPMLRVLRLPPDVPSAFLRDAIGEAARRVG